MALLAGQEEEDTKVRVAKRLEPKPHVGKTPNINTAHPYTTQQCTTNINTAHHCTTQLLQCQLQSADLWQTRVEKETNLARLAARDYSYS